MNPLFLVSLLAAAGVAQQPAAETSLMGQLAPPFLARTCINAPRIIDSRELLGEVIVLQFWGIT
ncbi:MAG: hypothetical protein HY812_06310 [Planctomycetes bacterium]|nr:hypothetical protein [Planctomycetota bacterium]